MFNWFWKFLYSISKTLFRLIDGLMSCANKLCGIETVTVNGEEQDFLYYLFSSDKVWFAFRVAALLGMIVLVLFTIIAIIRSIAKAKPEGTPTQIAFKAFKSFLMFLFVPATMVAVMWLGNVFMQAIYKATTVNSSSLGSFLFVSFADGNFATSDAASKFLTGEYLYTNTSTVMEYMTDISEFEFAFSYLAGGVILVSLASSMLLFVDRIISIIILYIVAPFSIASSVLDDGARFKLWRDQIIIKFVMGYGAIIAMNIYILICGLVVNDNLVFFTGEGTDFVNFLMKLLLIGGGALTLKKSMGLIGNLVQAGAGSNEMRDNELAYGGMKRAIAGAGGALATATGLKALTGIAGSAMDSKKRDLGERLLSSMGMSIKDNRARESADGGSGAYNGNKASFGGSQGASAVKDAITGSNGGGSGGSGSNGGGDNGNQNTAKQSGGAGNQMINNAIAGGATSGGRASPNDPTDDDEDLR